MTDAKEALEIIISARNSKGITQVELSKITGLTQQQISRFEKGGNITFTNLVKILNALGLGIR
jgi:transcriptional regulator with XRE-family HTH domain